MFLLIKKFPNRVLVGFRRTNISIHITTWYYKLVYIAFVTVPHLSVRLLFLGSTKILPDFLAIVDIYWIVCWNNWTGERLAVRLQFVNITHTNICCRYLVSFFFSRRPHLFICYLAWKGILLSVLFNLLSDITFQFLLKRYGG